MQTTASPRRVSSCSSSLRRRTGMRRRRLAFGAVRASLTTTTGQPPVFRDLQEALGDALGLAGVPHEVSTDCLAAARDDLVHVLVPGAYLPYVHPAAYPSPDQVRRTVLVITESPGDPGFERAAGLAESVAATFVLDAGAVAELARLGVRARPLRLRHAPALGGGWRGRGNR